jgi:TonB family protein
MIDMGLWHADDEQDMHFAVMEYCDESLAGVLRQRALTVSEARQLLAPTLDALKYLHAQGIVHGQISPVNILARGDQLKLAVDSLRRTGDTCPTGATTPYDAPEKASGTIAPSSDLWALGVTLHEALTARLPLRDNGGASESTDKLAAPFDEIVKGCLAREREQRLSITAIKNLLDRPGPELVPNPKLQTAQELPAVPEIRIARPEAVPAGKDPAPLDDEAGSTRGNRRALVVAACALVLLFAVLLIAHFSDNQQSAFTTSAPVSAAHLPAKANAAASNHSAAGSSSAGAPSLQVMPEISGKARSTINGTVKLRVRVAVNAEGKVSRATLAAHGPSAYFARQALEAARQWTFTPPVRDGKPQASDWMLRFEIRRSGTRAAAQQL